MTEQLSRITIKEATSSGPIAGLTTIVGYVIQFEPEAPAKREILRPVEPDEPNTEVEVGYSRNALEPTTIEYKSRKTELTVSEYRLFRYVNDRHRLEEQSEFDFAELSEALTGDECAMTQNAIGAIIRRLVKAMSDLSPPITLSIVKETLHVNSVE
jgi:hypothetical protein